MLKQIRKTKRTLALLLVFVQLFGLLLQLNPAVVGANAAGESPTNIINSNEEINTAEEVFVSQGLADVSALEVL